MKPKLLFLSLAMSLAVTSVSAESLKLYSAKSKVLVYPNMTLTKDQRKEFKSKEFRKYGYFTAMAVSKNGAWGTSGTHNELTSARETALAYCENYRKSNEAKCRLYAEIVPKDYTKREGYSLYMEDAEYFSNVFIKESGYKAVAASTGQHNWFTSGQPNLKAAKKEALRGCESERKAKQTKLGRGSKCRIIYIAAD